MPTLYPKEVSVNEANLARLIKTYTQAQESIVNELATATDWGVANRKQLLAQIDAVLEDLNKQTQEWLEKEIPKQYTAGANDAVMQLNNVGADVAVQTGFNRIHKDAIIGLVDETAAAFAQGLTGVSRSGQVLLGKLTREALTQKLAQGIIGGKALKEVRREIKGVLMEQGVGALVDKGGHTWTLDRYADMLFRTKQVEARNRGIANRLVENGYDLVQVSSHGTDHAECAIWEGKILSASGATRGYPTVMDATAAGLFHPNCKHAINVLVPKLADFTRAYDSSTKTLLPAGKSTRKQFEDVTRKLQLEPAALAQADFKKNIENLGGGVADVKGIKSAANKVIRDYNGDATKLKDGNRGYVLINNPKDPKELEAMKQKIGAIYPIDEKASKNRLDNENGYAYAMVNVKLPDGRLAEVQITYKEMWYAKTHGGEDLYKQISNKEDTTGESELKMEKLYQKAYQAALARIG